MRMDINNPLDAYYIVNNWSYEQLVEILFKYADEKFAKRIARKIEQARSINQLKQLLSL